MAKMGRPKIKIDVNQFEKLCHLQCTLVEISEYFGCSEDTIYRWCKLHYGLTFAEIFKKKSSGGRISLRRSMFEAALKGNITMMIWLSKQYLGMSDKQEVKQSSQVEVDMTGFKFIEPKE